MQHCSDINAAKNTETIGVGQTHDVKWAGRECKTPSGCSRGTVNPTRSRSIVGRLLENPTPSGVGGRQSFKVTARWIANSNSN